jgi:L-asparaginase II
MIVYLNGSPALRSGKAQRRGSNSGTVTPSYLAGETNDKEQFRNGSPGELFRSLSGGEGKRRRKAVQGKGMGFS